jgi:hypothetical protein
MRNLNAVFVFAYGGGFAKRTGIGGSWISNTKSPNPASQGRQKRKIRVLKPRTIC